MQTRSFILNVKYLIIGQGLAGSLLAFELLKRGDDFLLMDDAEKSASSRVALGGFTSVYGKRMVANEEMNNFISIAQETYAEIENSIQQKVFFKHHTYQSFATETEKNEFDTYSVNQSLNDIINLHPEEQAYIRNELGAYEIQISGRLDCLSLIMGITKLLKNKNKYLEETFMHNQLIGNGNGGWNYKNMHFENIIFCEGYKNIDNPFFNWLPFAPSRGVVLDIKAPLLGQNKILKKGITLIPADQGMFKAGSTYEREDLSPQSDAAGRKTLEKQLSAMLNCTYEIVKQKSGIRPGTKDRNPVLGSHPNHPSMYIFNGLGSRGVILAPYFALLLCDFMQKHQEISKKYSVQRFLKDKK